MNVKLSFALGLLSLLLPQLAMAYVGPGSGLSAFGALLALVSGVIVAIFGFLWYPLKRLFKKSKVETNDTEQPAASTVEQRDNTAATKQD